ncbi:MAG: Asp-tRNA(Asn)/Glu-tRNA(Gln) amidotransferase subunit GatC [Chloroflexia bacterium]
MLTPKEVRHVAMLARLGLTEAEVESLRVQLSDVLAHIAMLDKLDTSHIEPTAQVMAPRNVSRPDDIIPSLQPAHVLLNAPLAEEGFIRVPAVLEEVKVPTPSNTDSVN